MSEDEAVVRKESLKTHAIDVPQNRILVPERELQVSNVLNRKTESKCQRVASHFHFISRQPRQTNAFRVEVAGRRRDVSRQPDLWITSIKSAANRNGASDLHPSVTEHLQLHLEPVELEVSGVLRLRSCTSSHSCPVAMTISQRFRRRGANATRSQEQKRTCV